MTADRPANFTEAMANPIDRGIFADSLDIALGGGCGLCDTERDHMCVGCGKCRCFDHDTCVRPATTARTNTPDRLNADGSKTIKMKRACNGCGQQLGDVTDQEMARGINGLPLPDVRRECPTCGPTAPEPKCLPLRTVDGDETCLDGECDHAVEPGADYCTNTSKHTVCVTHSAITNDGQLTHGEPWPCRHTATHEPAV